MKKKISISFGKNSTCYLPIVSFLAQIRLEKNKKQTKIFRKCGIIFLIISIFLLIILDKNNSNSNFIIFSFFSVATVFFILYISALLSSIKPDRSIKRDWVEGAEILISDSRCLFVKITIEEYEEELIRKIKKQISDFENEIKEREGNILKLENILPGLSEEEDGELAEPMRQKIYIDKINISQCEVRINEYQNILEQIQN